MSLQPAFAIISYAPDPKFKLRFEGVNVSTELNDFDLLVDMVATGICHLEIHISELPEGFESPVMGVARYPRILGHEGSGYVRAVGSKVKVAKPGDAVVLSYDYCGSCQFCSINKPAFCSSFSRINMVGDTGNLYSSVTIPSQRVFGKFFGQSSLASLGVVAERCVVNITDMVRNKQELKMFAPLGCGFQTGAGAVTVTANAGPPDVVVVTGIGAVGLGAIVAARVAKCKRIIAVDRVESRLTLAVELGATHIVDTNNGGDIYEKISAVATSDRVSLAI